MLTKYLDNIKNNYNQVLLNKNDLYKFFYKETEKLYNEYYGLIKDKIVDSTDIELNKFDKYKVLFTETADDFIKQFYHMNEIIEYYYNLMYFIDYKLYESKNVKKIVSSQAILYNIIYINPYKETEITKTQLKYLYYAKEYNEIVIKNNKLKLDENVIECFIWENIIEPNIQNNNYIINLSQYVNDWPLEFISFIIQFLCNKEVLIYSFINIYFETKLCIFNIKNNEIIDKIVSSYKLMDSYIIKQKNGINIKDNFCELIKNFNEEEIELAIEINENDLKEIIDEHSIDINILINELNENNYSNLLQKIESIVEIEKCFFTKFIKSIEEIGKYLKHYEETNKKDVTSEMKEKYILLKENYAFLENEFYNANIIIDKITEKFKKYHSYNLMVQVYDALEKIYNDRIDKNSQNNLNDKGLTNKKKKEYIINFFLDANNQAENYREKYGEFKISISDAENLYKSIEKNEKIINGLSTGEMIYIENINNPYFMNGDYTTLIANQVKIVERYLKEVLVQLYPKNIWRFKRNRDNKVEKECKISFLDACLSELTADYLSISRNYENKFDLYNENNIKIEKNKPKNKNVMELGPINLALEEVNKANNLFGNTLNSELIQKVRNGVFHIGQIDTMEEAKDTHSKLAYWFARCIITIGHNLDR